MLVVHVSFECAPMYKTGGLGDVVGSLPKALAIKGIESAVIMPAYGWIRPLTHLPFSRVPIYYIENKWFKRTKPDHAPEYQAQAYAYFCFQVLEFLKSKKIRPDIIHCHDWHTGLIPFFLHTRPDPHFESTKTVLTIHNSAYQGNFKRKYFEAPETKVFSESLPKQKYIHFLELGIEYADTISTVSPNHAQEIISGGVNFGLSKSIKKRKTAFVGILNGLDYSVWNPQTDPYIIHKYSAKTVGVGKMKNKYTLQKQLGLLISDRVPLFAFIARLNRQKGLDLLLPLLERFVGNYQLVVLGTGDKKYERALKRYDRQEYRDFISINISFDEKLAHRIYAGADFMLIPSHYEPCGLTQLIGFAYGTVPIASHVGGLVDSISQGKTGFLFNSTATAFWQTIQEAHEFWLRKQEFMSLVTQILRENFSWVKSAQEYIALYRKVLA